MKYKSKVDRGTEIFWRSIQGFFTDVSTASIWIHPNEWNGCIFLSRQSQFQPECSLSYSEWKSWCPIIPFFRHKCAFNFASIVSVSPFWVHLFILLQHRIVQWHSCVTMTVSLVCCQETWPARTQPCSQLVCHLLPINFRNFDWMVLWVKRHAVWIFWQNFM